MSKKTPYELGCKAATNDFKTGDRSNNPYDWDTQWISYCNWDMGYNNIPIGQKYKRS